MVNGTAENGPVRSAAVLVGVLLAACSPVSPRSADFDLPPDTEPFVRACGTDQGGRLDRADWGEDAVVVGSFAFLNGQSLADPTMSAEYAPREGGLYRGQKALVAVDPGVTVTVVVPPHERELFSLLYDPDPSSSGSEEVGQFLFLPLYRVLDGAIATTFIGCDRDIDTQFAGGVIVAGARCVDLDFYVGDAVEPQRETVSFGAGDCA